MVVTSYAVEPGVEEGRLGCDARVRVEVEEFSQQVCEAIVGADILQLSAPLHSINGAGG